METLTCLATWSEGDKTFLLGRLRRSTDKINNRIRMEDQVRCILYRAKPGGGGGGGFHVAQSGSPSCAGLARAASDGVRRFNVKPAQGLPRPQQQQQQQQQKGCRFPPWATKVGRFLTFYYTSEYVFESTELVIHEYNYLAQKVITVMMRLIGLI